VYSSLVTEIMVKHTTDNEVLSYVGNEPISNAEIARQIGIHRSCVAPRIERLEKAGLVTKTTDGKWVLSQGKSQSVS